MVKPSHDCVSVRVILREGYSQFEEVGNLERFFVLFEIIRNERVKLTHDSFVDK